MSLPVISLPCGLQEHVLCVSAKAHKISHVSQDMKAAGYVKVEHTMSAMAFKTNTVHHWNTSWVLPLINWFEAVPLLECTCRRRDLSDAWDCWV